MKKVHVYLKDNGGYEIIHEFNTIIDTNDKPLRTYHEVIDTLFPNAEISVSHESDKTKGLTLQESKDKFEASTEVDDLDKINPFAGKVEFGKYKNTFSNPEDVFNEDDTEDDMKTEQKQNINSINKEPISGDVDVPTMGDIIYIDGITQTLSKITGGLATVLSVKETTDAVVVDSTETFTGVNEWNEEEYENEDICENNVLVELEEFPGMFVSWTMIKDQQEVLKEMYNYTTAKKISLFS